VSDLNDRNPGIFELFSLGNSADKFVLSAYGIPLHLASLQYHHIPAAMKKLILLSLVIVQTLTLTAQHTEFTIHDNGLIYDEQDRM
jgi:hypothetical protein